MPPPLEPAALHEWYAVESTHSVTATPQRSQLLGHDIVLERDPAGHVTARTALGRPLPVRDRYGCIWTSLGTPARDIFAIPEASEPDRRFVLCGWVTIRASGLRVVENFLDMAHFPFVHTGILGAPPHTEVPRYSADIRRDSDEMWATGCTFFQSRIAVTEAAGDVVHLAFRVPAPFVVMLYRRCPTAPERLDVILLVVQPLQPGLCRAQPVMYLVDPASAHTALLHFEQVIFLQDRVVVENQRPVLLPLDARSEIPTRADLSSVTYRRWLKQRGLRFGTTAGPP